MPGILFGDPDPGLPGCGRGWELSNGDTPFDLKLCCCLIPA